MPSGRILGLVEAGRARSSRTTTSGTAESRSRSSSAAHSSNASVTSTNASGSARGALGSGEEIDYLIRGVRAGARIEYDPSLVVRHAFGRTTPESARRDGASVGYLLRKHATRRGSSRACSSALSAACSPPPSGSTASARAVLARDASAVAYAATAVRGGRRSRRDGRARARARTARPRDAAPRPR